MFFECDRRAETRFVGITYHIHHTSLRLLLSSCAHTSYISSTFRNEKTVVAYTHGSISKYYSNTLHIESEVYHPVGRLYK